MKFGKVSELFIVFELVEVENVNLSCD